MSKTSIYQEATARGGEEPHPLKEGKQADPRRAAWCWAFIHSTHMTTCTDPYRRVKVFLKEKDDPAPSMPSRARERAYIIIEHPLPYRPSAWLVEAEEAGFRV